MCRPTAARPASSCSAPRPPATPRSRRRSTMSGPIRARKTSAAGSVTPATLGLGNLPRGVDFATGSKRSTPQARSRLERPGVDQAGVRPAGDAEGVQSAKAAAMAVKVGLDAVWVPTMAAAPSTACRRPSQCCRASRRRWTAVFRSSSTLACGAPITCSRRWRSAPPWSAWAGRSCTAWRSAAQGVQSVLEHVRDNLTIIMRLAGTKNVKEITRDYLAPPAIA